MTQLKLRCEGNIKDLLSKAPYEWRATGTFGVELFLQNGHQTNEYMVYVKKEDIQGWKQYLSAGGARETPIIPNIRLIVSDALPKPYQGNIVNLETLAYDLQNRVIARYKENHPEVLEKIEEHKKLEPAY